MTTKNNTSTPPSLSDRLANHLGVTREENFETEPELYVGMDKSNGKAHVFLDDNYLDSDFEDAKECLDFIQEDRGSSFNNTEGYLTCEHPKTLDSRGRFQTRMHGLDAFFKFIQKNKIYFGSIKKNKCFDKTFWIGFSIYTSIAFMSRKTSINLVLFRGGKDIIVQRREPSEDYETDIYKNELVHIAQMSDWLKPAKKTQELISGFFEKIGFDDDNIKKIPHHWMVQISHFMAVCAWDQEHQKRDSKTKALNTLIFDGDEPVNFYNTMNKLAQVAPVRNRGLLQRPLWNSAEKFRSLLYISFLIHEAGEFEPGKRRDFSPIYFMLTRPNDHRHSQFEDRVFYSNSEAKKEFYAIERFILNSFIKTKQGRSTDAESKRGRKRSFEHMMSQLKKTSLNLTKNTYDEIGPLYSASKTSGSDTEDNPDPQPATDKMKKYSIFDIISGQVPPPPLSFFDAPCDDDAGAKS